MTNEELAVAIKAGETECINQLWDQCYKFVRKQALKWALAWKNRPDFDVDDFMQSGFIALRKAVDKYDPTQGYSFINCLDFCLKTEFSNVASCRTPAQLKEPLNNAMSLDAPMYNDTDNETTLGDTIAVSDPALDAVDESIFAEYVCTTVKTAVNSLPERQRFAVDEHYLKGKTYGQIADMLCVSKSYPEQLAKDGVKKLRKSEYIEELSEIYYGDRNLYQHTSKGFFRRTRCSVQEYELLRRELLHYGKSGDKI